MECIESSKQSHYSFRGYFIVAGGVLGVMATSASMAETKIVKHHHSYRNRAGIIHSSPETIHVQSSHVFDGVTRRAPGGGLIRPQIAPKARSTVSQDYIAKQAPAQNAYNFAKMMPGVVVANTDPAGHEKSALSMRGLTQDEIANTYDGMPLSSVGGYNLDLAWVVDSENIGTVTAQPGSANLDTAAVNASGGAFYLTSRNPSKKAGGTFDVGAGSSNYTREFLRLESGEIGHSGIRSFISVSNQHDTFYHGPGNESFQHVDFKVLKEWDEGNRISLIGGFMRGLAGNEPYWNTTMANWHTLGWKNQLSRYYNPSQQNPDYWKLNWLHSRTYNILAPSKFTYGHVHLDITPYTAYNYKSYGSGQKLNNNVYYGNQLITGMIIPGQLPGHNTGLAEGYSTLNEMRGGFVAKVTLDVGVNHPYFGYWFDYDNSTNRNGYTGVNQDGSPYTPYGWTSKTLRMPDGRPFYTANYSDITKTHALFAGDTLKLLRDHLIFDGGMRVVMINRNATERIPGLPYKLGRNELQLLPQLGGHYQLTRNWQVFAGVATGAKAAPDSYLISTINPNTGSFVSKGNNRVKDEYSISEEAGVRYNDKLFVGSLTYFHYNFTNRQISTYGYLGNQQVAENINGGGQTSDGVDFEIGTRPFFNFRPYVSAQYLHSILNNNLRVGDDFLPTKGKHSTNAPKWTVSFGLDWDNGPFFWNFDLTYFSRQYSTFMNDEYLPKLATLNLTVGARLLPDTYIGKYLSFLKSPEIMLWVNNLADTKAYSAINSVKMNAQSVRGLRGTLIPGAAPTYNTLSRFYAIVTFRTGF
ncbi:TonB-dependent receptor [Saccharibacter sp. 17.LH.SD]|uniref:TonB-dependent receptor n=1 Tax=Saccharibacter sp. 17.LH.SD TaxID=2689393 RepID=UPI00136CA7FA|nr:TonB-dependent receptor [Saccharibacter sp. 17.LH.SD]MXV43701.1 TonB-dependent receptor [Saccharibacter sp. 17.LH.SD]